MHVSSCARWACSGLLLAALSVNGCGRQPAVDAGGRVTIIFKHAKHPRYTVLSQLIQQFEREHPHIRVVEEVLPASTDEQHQFYVINLAAGAQDFDVLDMDVIWVPEFARAGWLADLSPHFTASDLAPLHPAALRADRLNGKLYGLPWFVDAGVLYYRRDLLEKHGFSPPRTYPELLHIARQIQKAEGDPQLNGFVWQGLQYEGLVCAALEFIRGNGGDVFDPAGALHLTSPRTLEALAFVDGLIRREGVTPALVTTLNEEAARHIFQSGRAVFMRNWPYAWRLLQQEGSAVQGRVGLAVVPHFSGSESAPTLGGFHLGVNSRSGRKAEAVAFVKFMLRYETQKQIILNVGVLPAHTGVYQDAEVRRALPHLSDLWPSLERVQPRPVTPYYLMISQILQPELSAVVAGIRPPAEAMQSAEQQIRYLLGGQ